MNNLTSDSTVTVTLDNGNIISGVHVYPRSMTTCNGYRAYVRGLKTAARRNGLRFPRGWSVAIDLDHSTNTQIALEQCQNGYFGPIGTIPGSVVID